MRSAAVMLLLGGDMAAHLTESHGYYAISC